MRLQDSVAPRQATRPRYLSWPIMTKPSILDKLPFLQDLQVEHSVLPLDIADRSETSLVKFFQLLDVISVRCASLAKLASRDPLLLVSDPSSTTPWQT